MNCKEARKWISPYLDSDLGSTKTFEVSEHLRTCEKCAARFEAERRADDLVRDRLAKDTMPTELWEGVVRAVSAPSWVRVLRSRRYWAIAACVALAVAGVTLLSSNRFLGNEPLIVRQFVAETPDNSPFPVLGGGMNPASLDSFLRDTLGVAFSTASDMAAMGHMRFQVVSTASRTDDDGREYVEVRLNCCGEPIILVLAKSNGRAWPLEINQLADARSKLPLQSFGGVRVRVQDLGGVRAVAVSRHSTDHVLAALSRADA